MSEILSFFFQGQRIWAQIGTNCNVPRGLEWRQRLFRCYPQLVHPDQESSQFQIRRYHGESGDRGGGGKTNLGKGG